MMLQHIQSKDNPKIKHLRGLIEQSALRKKNHQTVLEGAHLLDSYLDMQPTEQITVFTTESGMEHPENEAVLTRLDEMRPHFQLFVITAEMYQGLSTLAHSVPLLTVINIPSIDNGAASWNPQQDALIFDQVQDPGNVGTLLRSAAAVGVTQVLTTIGTAGLWSPKVLRAAMGAHFSLKLYEGIAIEQILQDFSGRLYATSSHQATDIYHCNLSQPCAWILGNEGKGVQSALLDEAQAVTIPQPGGQESLNVAIAGSVCLFEMMRQRQYAAI